MPEEKLSIKSRSIISLVSLLCQSGYSAFLGLGANLILTILLSPTIFGIYITVLSIISLLNYFSDIGLAASLIQKKEISNDDVKTTFTVQQLLIISLLFIGFSLTSVVQRFYNLPQEGVYLYWALLVSFFISSAKTIPSIFLERKIQFHKIVVVQVVENTVFYVTVSLLALWGFGITSFTYAVLVRAVVGLVLIYSISFWLPQIGISGQSLRMLLSFGLPFQASSFLALFKDDLITLFLSKILGFAGVGYVGWAKKWAEAPLRIVMDNVTKVLFPVISRMQDDKKKVGLIIEKIIYFQTALLAPLMLTAAFVMPKLIYIIPKYAKWSPAIPIFYIFVLSSFLVTYSAPFINVFNALGKTKLSLMFMTFWTVLMWLLTPVMSERFGYYGFPIVHLMISLTFGLVIWQAKKLFPLNLLSNIIPFIVAAAVMGTTLYGTDLLLKADSILIIGSQVALAGTLYMIVLLVVFKINLIRDIFELLKNKHSPL